MTQEEHDKWDRWYWEAVDREFARKMYEQCDREDAEKERQFQEWQLLHETCIETFMADVNCCDSCPDCGRLVMCHKHSRLSEEIELIEKAVRTRLAALSTPAPCGVEGHTMATWFEGTTDLEFIDGIAVARVAGELPYCKLCTTYAKGQLDEVVIWFGSHVGCNCPGCQHKTKLEADIRALPVTGLAEGKENRMLDQEKLPRCEKLDGSTLKIVPAYTEAGQFCEANVVTIEDMEGRRAVYVPLDLQHAKPSQANAASVARGDK